MTTPIEYRQGGERPYDLYYRHSGYTPVPSIVLAGLAGLAAGLVVAFIYAYAIEYIPFIKLRFLATVGFGAIVGGVTAAIAKAGKVRSVAVVMAIVAVVTLAAYYFAWVVWVKAVLDRYGGPRFHVSLGTLLSTPTMFKDLVQMLNETGTWAMSKSDKENVSGTFLTVIWLIEAAAIFGMAFVVAVPMVRSEMFCETCNRWCGKAVTLRQTAKGDPKLLKESLEAHDFSYLNSLGPAQSGQFWSLEYEGCNKCNGLHALSVREHKVTVNKKGAVTGNTNKMLVTKLLLEPDELAELKAPRPPVGQVPPMVPPPPPRPPVA